MSLHPVSKVVRSARLLAVASGLLVGTPALAYSVQVTDLNEFYNALNEPDVTEVELAADIVSGTSDYGWFIFFDLAGTEKTILAHDFSLPLMKVGNGKLIIEDGRFDALTLQAWDTYAANNDTSAYMSRHFMRIYGDTEVVLKGTDLSIPPEADDEPVILPSIFELYSQESSPLTGGTPTTGASLILNSVTATNHPITRAIAVSSADTPLATSLTIENSILDFGQHGLVHAVRWRTTDDTEQVPDSRVIIDRSWLRGAEAENTAQGGPWVGTKLSLGSGVTKRLPFVRSAGTIDVKRARLSNFVSYYEPILLAPRVLIDETMVDGMHLTPAETENATVAEGLNVAVARSLMCDLQGGTVAFRSPEALESSYDTPRSIYLMNSAFWQLHHPLFSMDLPNWLDPASPQVESSGLVAANLTVHQSDPPTTGGTRDLVPLPYPSMLEPHGLVLNTYLQGPWRLGDLVAETGDADESDAIQPRNVVISEPGGTTDPCEAREGCVPLSHDYLHEEFLERDCAEVMDSFTEVLLSGSLEASGASLSAISPDLFPGLEQRPALEWVDHGVPGEDWAFPSADDFGQWGSDIVWCEATVDEEDIEVGAWSSDSGTCSLPLLEPVRPDEGTDTGDDPDPDPDLDSGEPPDPDDHEVDDEADAPGSRYGLTSGCRYGGGAAWLLVPLFFGRRRRSAADAS